MTMKRKSITIYTAIISAVFAFCIGFFAYNIHYEYSHGIPRAKKTCEHVMDSIRRYGEGANFERLFENIDDWSAIYMEKNGEAIISYPNDSAASAEETRFVRVYRSQVRHNGENYNLVLAIYTLRPAVIFYYARFSFIAVLIATIFSVVLIFYFTLTSRTDFKKAESTSKNCFKDFLGSGGEEPFHNEVLTEPEDARLTEDETEKSPEEAEDGLSIDGADEDSFCSFQKDIQEEFSRNDAEKEEADKDSTTKETACEHSEKRSEGESPYDYDVPPLPFNADDDGGTNEAKEIFSSRTGFCNESQLLGRLETELIHAASDEQDLSLILIRIPGISFSNPIVKDISSYLLNENLFRNFIFEYKSDGFAVLRKDMAIEEAESYAETMLGSIKRILEGSDFRCFIGISSRNIRMLSGERLVKEAEEALRHSEADGESQITAFHVDIEKYREFLKDRNRKSN